MPTCMYTYMHAIYTYMYTRSTCTYIHTCMYTYIHMYVYIYTHVCIHIYIYTGRCACVSMAQDSLCTCDASGGIEVLDIFWHVGSEKAYTRATTL